MAAMTLARLALLVVVYVSLDLSNPMMPGALAFGIEETVEVRQSDRFRHETHAPLVPLAPAPRRLDSPARAAARRRPLPPVTPHIRWARAPRAPLSASVPASPSEDH